jgi:hypothetical protein
MWQSQAPLEGSRKESFLLLPASGGSWCSLAYGPITLVSASVYHVSFNFLLQRQLSSDLGTTLPRHNLIFIPSAKTLFPNKLESTGLGLPYIFGGDTIQPTEDGTALLTHLCKQGIDYQSS